MRNILRLVYKDKHMWVARFGKLKTDQVGFQQLVS